MTEKQKEIIKVLCDCNMNTTATAKKMFHHRANIEYHIAQIKKKTGLNPRVFNDLVKLREMAEVDRMKLGDLLNPKQYALKVLEMFLHKQCDLERTKFAYTQEEVWGSVKMAAEALEKQIPKKPVDRIVFKECPNCQNVHIEYCEFCCDCGQALDWGEEDE